MRTYAILLPSEEDSWENATPQTRKRVYAQHEEFSRLLAERGHRVTGGAELTHSREARVVRGRLDAVTATEGPYAESVEQFTGFYLVQSSDLDDLLQVCGQLADAEGAVEVRPVVDHDEAP